MSTPSADKSRSTMDVSVHSPRSAMPFIEEDVEIKSEIKSEPTGRESPLFEPQSNKRSIDDEISVVDIKKQKILTESGPQAYSGNPVRQYIPGTPYNYSRQEAAPELEINSKHHQDALRRFPHCLEKVVLPSLLPIKDEDKSINDMVVWLKHNTKVPAILPTRFALFGSSGSGKTSTLNNLLGIPDLAISDVAMSSVTQNPQLFNHEPNPDTTYEVEVELLHGRPIENLIKQCVTDLVDYYKFISSDEDEDEKDYVGESAESSRQIFDDLFSHQGGLKSVDDIEDFLRTRDLLPQEGESISESAVEALYQQVKERALSEKINLDSREVILTAGNLGELHAKATKFSGRGYFAPLVTSMRTKLYSSLLSMGIEIADLPGYTDTNVHLRKISTAYSDDCPKAIFVANLTRSLTTPEFKKSLRETIKAKGAENVCVVLTGKDKIPKSTDKWTRDEIAHVKTLEKSLEAAKAQLDLLDGDIISQATAEVQNIERQILEYRISVRERVIADHFSQRDYRDKHNSTKIRVITVANKCHEQHVLGNDEAILPVDMTGIKDLRAYLCATPSKDRVRAFARHSAYSITKLRRIAIWAAGPAMPPRDAAMALFEQYTRWSVKEHKATILKASVQYKKSLNGRFTSTWAAAAQEKIDGWIATYAARTQSVFIRQGGRHSPKLKSLRGSKTEGKNVPKPKLVSWPEDLLTVAEDDVLSLLDSTWDVIKEIEGFICRDIRNVVKQISRGLKELNTIGGTNLEHVFTLFEEQRDIYTRDVEEGIKELTAELKSTALKSVADEPCDEDSPIFVKEMSKIFKTAFSKFPPKTKNVTKERIIYIRDQIASNKGPYAMMSNEIQTNMVPVINDWANKTNARIEKLHGDLGDVLFKSFDGIQMSDARRKQVGTPIQEAMENAIAVLQADLDGYAADII